MKLYIALVAQAGGLAAAALLKRAGHDVTVYEQAPRFARVGAGIQMAPNAVKVLRALGVEEQLTRIAFQSDVAISREWNTGEVTSTLKLGHEVEERFGAPYLYLHRGDLHAAIHAVVPEGVVRRGMKLAGLDQESGAQIDRRIVRQAEPARTEVRSALAHIARARPDSGTQASLSERIVDAHDCG